MDSSFRTLLVVLAMGLVGIAAAATLNVPGDYPTIQGAIDAATPGDEIVVAPGRYKEHLVLPGFDLVLRSTDPTSATVVDATVVEWYQGYQSARSVIECNGGETSTCRIAGFTLRGGVRTEGGGIRGNGTHATIRHNHITDNLAMYGGGLWRCDGLITDNRITSNTASVTSSGGGSGGGLYRCNGEIRNNEIRNNHASSGGGGIGECDGLIEQNILEGNAADGTGGGIYGGYSSGAGIIRRNWIRGNSATYYGSRGGGIGLYKGTIEQNVISGNFVTGDGGGLYECEGIIRNNLIVDNHAQQRGGGLIGHWKKPAYLLNNVFHGNLADKTGGGIANSYGVLRNNAVWGNEAPAAPQVHKGDEPAYSCIQDWPTTMGLGNINSDPRFVDADGGDFHLLPDSPCIDAGGATLDVMDDFDGVSRPLDGTPDAPRGDGSGWDIGAFEFPGALLPTPTPPPELIRDALLNQTFPRAYLDLNADGVVDIADLVRASAP